MKRIRLDLLAGALIALSLLSSCINTGDPKNFPTGCPNFTDKRYAGDLVEAMAPGIYEFKTSENFGKSCVLAKSTDGWVFWLPEIGFIDAGKTNVIGSSIYYGFYDTVNKTYSFSLFGETYKEGKAQYYNQREFLTREAMYKGVVAPAGEPKEEYNYAVKCAEGILQYPMALAAVAYRYKSFLDSWDAPTKDNVCGIPVTCYVQDGHDYYVDENWMCLRHVNHHMLNSETGNIAHDLVNFYEAGDYKQTYARIYELYGPSLPKPEWDTSVRCYFKQSDEWLTNEYPRALDQWLKVYDGVGTIHDMEIWRRVPWTSSLDQVCTITVRIENAGYDDAIAYKNWAASICNDINKDQFDPNARTLHFKGSYDPEDISGVSFGDSYYHPGYDIRLNSEGTLVIVLDVIKTTVV